MRRIAVTGAVLSAVACLLLPAAGAEGWTVDALLAKSRRLSAKLKTETERLHRLERRLEAARFSRREAGELRGANSALREELAERDARIESLAGSNVAAAIRATPIASFPSAVFAPAREVWPCDSYISGSGFWSYSFESPNLCP